MLPLLRDHMTIALSPNHFSMVRLKGLFGKHQVTAKYSQVIENESNAEGNWLAVIEALNVQLKKSIWQNANVKIVIANSFTRYFLLPWSHSILNENEEQQFAKYKMEEIFGTASKENWEITLGSTLHGQSRLACAIDAEFLTSLRQALLKADLSVQSIEPHLITALSYWKSRLIEKHFYFLLSDGEKLCIALFKDGFLNNISLEISSGLFDADSINTQLNRHALINGNLSGTIKAYIFSTNQTPVSISNSSYKLELLKLPNAYLNQENALLAAARVN